MQKEEKVLRGVAEEVPIEEISSEKVRTVIAEMKEVLAKEDDGAALAAPQIGIPLRIFIISGKILCANSEKPKPDLVFINPKIAGVSKKTQEIEEGCLSARWLYGLVRRSEKARIEAYDENGKKFTRSGSGLMAQIFQHEVDHLNGVLFIDRAKKVEEYRPDEGKSMSI